MLFWPLQRLWPPWSNHYHRYYDQTTASRLSTARNTTDNQRYTAIRCAVAVAGQTRTMATVGESLLQNVVRPLDADVFLHLSSEFTVPGWQRYFSLQGENRELAPPGSDGGTRVVYTKATQMAYVLRKFSPVRYAVQDGLTLFDRWALLYDLIVSHEVASRFRYDWVIRTRPDLFFGCSMTHSLLQALVSAPGFYWDFVAILPRPISPAGSRENKRRH